MTHIDPFAPADSPQHPINFVPDGEPRSQTLRHEAMSPLLAIDDEPVWSDDPNAAMVGQTRWEEYGFLITEHGFLEERKAWDEASAVGDNGESYEYSVTEPSLATLRARAADAAAVVADPTADLDETPPPATEDDLAAKLKALDEENL